MIASRTRPLLFALNNSPLILFAVVLLIFGGLTRDIPKTIHFLWNGDLQSALHSARFLAPANLVNILVQSSPTAIVAIGMTFVLLTAGVDLSVGAIMFVTAAVAGKLVLSGWPLGLAMVVILLIGLGYGALNAFFIVRLRIIAFITTLGTLYLGRGFGLWLTETRAMNLPEGFLELGTAGVAGVPLPILILTFVLVAGQLVLTRTPFGRQIYALGQDLEAARKAGIRAGRILASVYVISGLCAAIGGILALAQLGAVSPTFGEKKEFAAIAAAVLGGTSLFGGRGQVFPGTVLGAVLIQSVENGLVILNADPYAYPLITSLIIFVAVLTDSLRNVLLTKLSRRKIRVESGEVCS